MSRIKQKSVVIIGAGIGGLCAAARLLKNGYRVKIIEKENMVGGRAHRFVQDGYTFDMGPTLLMMTDVLYETFSYCGKNLDDYLELIQLEPNYQVNFANKRHITVSSNLPRFVTELDKFDPKASAQFFRFFGDLADMYRISRGSFIDKNFDKLTDFISPKAGVELLVRGGLSKLYKFVSGYFDDEHLRQLFSFQSMYLGVSPYDAPAIYSIVSYMETGLGIWYPKGGMYSLSQGLAKLVNNLGGEIVLNSEVERIIIKNQAAVGVEIKNGEKVDSDLVVANADLVYSHLKLINSHDRPSMRNSKLTKYRQASSALLFYWGVKDVCKGMLHHNVYLCNNFKKNIDEIFYEKKMPNDPSFYTYIPTKTDPGLAPNNRQAFYVLVPVPNLSANLNWDKETIKIRQKVLNRIKDVYKLDIENKIEIERVFSPHDFENKFNLHIGSAFGLSHNFFQSGYFRPHNKSRDINNLYFVGASTYPGGGIPMVSLSAKLATERIINEQHAKFKKTN